MNFDLRTLILIIGITHILQFIVFYIQFKVVKEYKGIGWWLLWTAVEVIGFFAILLRDIPSILPLAIIIQNTAIISGTIFIYIGVLRFFNKKENRKFIVILFSLYLIGLLFFLFVQNNIQARSIIINSMLAIVAFITAYSLFRYKISSVRVSANFNSIVLLVHGIIFLYRTVILISGTPIEDTFSPTLFNMLPFFDALTVGLLWTFGFVIMINQRLNSEMKEAKEHFENVFNTSPDGAVISRLSDGLIIDINAGYTVLTGYTRDDSVGKSSLEINLWKNPEDRKAVVSMLQEKGNCYNYEAVFIRKNGTELTGLMSAKIIALQDTPHIISITREITERKKVEEEIRKLNEELEHRVKERTEELELKSKELKDNEGALLNLVEDLNEKTNQLALSSNQLEQANRELEAFSYSVSHDLRAPLRGIDGFSLALFEDYFDKLDEKAKDYISRIRKSTKRMDELIDSMLRLSRVTRYELNFTDIKLSDLAGEVLLKLSSSDEKRNVEFGITKNIIVKGDKYLLEILLDNLLNNALKFTAKNEKTVIELGTFKKDSDVVYFIRDNGVGFDMKYYDKLFGAFQRLHSKNDFPGTGIGLATVQRIIRRHNGKIWAESEVGKGTTFYFTLKG